MNARSGYRPAAARRSLARRAGTALVLIGATTASPSVAAARSAPQCSQLSFSATFAHDGVALCAQSTDDPTTHKPRSKVLVYVTHDAGRSWAQAAAAGIVIQDSVLGHTYVSPDYAHDHALYVTTSTSLFRSTDDGATFTLADSLVGDDDSPNAGLTAYTDDNATGLPTLAGTPVGLRAEFAFAGPNPQRPSAKLDYPLHLPVVGAPGNRRFLIPTTFDRDHQAFVVTENTGTSTADERVRLFGCDATLACATPLFAFPAGLSFTDSWIAPDFATSHGLTIALSSVDHYHLSLWRSRDAGRTFTPWTSIDTRLAALSRLPHFSDVAVGLATDVSARRLYVHITYGVAPPFQAGLPPTEQLLVSTDNGAIWKQVGYQRDDLQPGHRGTLPWTVSNDISAPAPHRLFVVGQPRGQAYFAPFCSTDNGRTWHRLCPS